MNQTDPFNVKCGDQSPNFPMETRPLIFLIFDPDILESLILKGLKIKLDEIF